MFRGKVPHLQPFGGRLSDVVKYTPLGVLLATFFSTRLGRTARQTAAPSILKHVFPACKEVSFGGLVDTLPFFWNFGGPR